MNARCEESFRSTLLANELRESRSDLTVDGLREALGDWRGYTAEAEASNVDSNPEVRPRRTSQRRRSRQLRDHRRLARQRRPHPRPLRPKPRLPRTCRKELRRLTASRVWSRSSCRWGRAWRRSSARATIVEDPQMGSAQMGSARTAGFDHVSLIPLSLGHKPQRSECPDQPSPASAEPSSGATSYGCTAIRPRLSRGTLPANRFRAQHRLPMSYQVRTRWAANGTAHCA